MRPSRCQKKRSTTNLPSWGCDPVIRVLVVDDSSTVRRIMLNALAGEPSVKVVATASDGVDAVEQVKANQVDVVITDLEMPRMDGIGLINALGQSHKDLPVIVMSKAASTSRATVAALAAGAVDFVTKPGGDGDNGRMSAESLRDLLVPKIKLHAARRARTATQTERAGNTPTKPGFKPGGTTTMLTRTAPAGTGQLRPRTKQQRIDAVGIAISTGGPHALARFVAELPADIGVPILVVQHMPPTFTQLLAERLDTTCALPVREAQGGEVLNGGGELWIAPGGKHLIAQRQGARIQLALNDGPPEQSCKPAADVLMRSMAQVWGQNLLGLVMTGMGADGTAGSRAIVDAGGCVMAQDEATSVVWGMPGSVVRAGLVDQVLPLDALARELTSRVRQGRLSR